MQSFQSLVTVFLVGLLSSTTLASPTPTKPHEAGKIVESFGAVDTVEIYQDSPNTPSVPDHHPWTGVTERRNGAHNIHALVKFDFDGTAWQADKYDCKVQFEDAYRLTGSKTFQVYTLGSSEIAGATWDDRPFRDQHVGTFVAKEQGQGPAGWEFGGSFRCPTEKGVKVAFEIVPVGDDDSAYWRILEGGPRVEVVEKF